MLDESSNIHSFKTACSTLDQALFSGPTWNDRIGFHSLQNRVGKGLESYAVIRCAGRGSIPSIRSEVEIWVSTFFLIRGLLAISNTFDQFDRRYTTSRSRQPAGRFDPFHLQSPCQRPNRQGWKRRGGGAFELCNHNHYIIRGAGRGDMPTRLK